MKKFFIVLAGLSVVVCAIYAGSKMYEKNNNSSEQVKMDSLAEVIEDDCTEQWNELNSLEQDNIQANSQESVRLSPKCSVIYETKYEKCGHVSRDVDGKVVVNLLNENGEEKEFEKTDISIEYLTDTDKIDIENGLKVYGKENLSQIIEDYE